MKNSYSLRWITHRINSYARSENRPRQLTKGLIALLIFSVAFAVYIQSEVTSRTDTVWSMYIAASILREGDTDLDEYAHLIPADDYRVEYIEGHIYSTFPVAGPAFAAPLLLAFEGYQRIIKHSSFVTYLTVHQPDPVVFEVEKLIASLITAASVIVILGIANQYTSFWRACLVALIVGFATSAWSTASRGLWQHGPSMLAISIAIFLIIQAREHSWFIYISALPLATAYMIRPTNLIPILVLSVYVVTSTKTRAIKYFILLFLPLIPFFLYNHSIYGVFVPPYFQPNRLEITSRFAEAMLGNLVSPSRGLFIFSPLIIFCIYGIYLLRKQPDSPRIWPFFVIILIFHWISISMFGHWYGGWSIGPRFFTDILPFCAFFLIPVVNHLPGLGTGWNPKLIFFLGFLSISIFVQLRCSTSWAAFNWNNTPTNIDDSLDRIWDWADIQYLRGLCPSHDYQAPGCWQEMIVHKFRSFSSISKIMDKSNQASGTFLTRSSMRINPKIPEQNKTVPLLHPKCSSSGGVVRQLISYCFPLKAAGYLSG